MFKLGLKHLNFIDVKNHSSVRYESNMKVFLFFISAMCSVDTLLLKRMRSVYGKLRSTCYVLKSNWRHYSCSTGIQTLHMSSDDIGGQQLTTSIDNEYLTNDDVT